MLEEKMANTINVEPENITEPQNEIVEVEIVPLSE